MNSPSLYYSEWQKEGPPIPLSFIKVCPDSSGTIKDQTTEKEGISIVAFFSSEDKKQIRKNVMDQIDDLNYGFIPTKNLHSTFLTIYPTNGFEGKLNSDFTELIKNELNKFFEGRIDKKKLTLKFDEFRPGTWYNLHNRSISDASNGTVVAIGNPYEKGNREFIDIAKKLVCHLRKNLGQIFSDKFDRKYATIWSTLGYFNTNDFDISQKFADTFNQLKNNSININIDSLWLVEYYFKDLRDEGKNNLLQFQLQ